MSWMKPPAAEAVLAIRGTDGTETPFARRRAPAARIPASLADAPAAATDY